MIQNTSSLFVEIVFVQFAVVTRVKSRNVRGMVQLLLWSF
jgi:hypothetical protein